MLSCYPCSNFMQFIRVYNLYISSGLHDMASMNCAATRRNMACDLVRMQNLVRLAYIVQLCLVDVSFYSHVMYE